MNRGLRLIQLVSAALALLLLLNGQAAAQGPGGDGGQRFELLNRRGGLVADALPLPDGRVMLAQGERLSLLSFSGDEGRIASEIAPGIGPLLDLQALDADRALALGADGLLSLDIRRWPPAILGRMPGGAQAIRVKGDLIALPMREAGLRLLRVETDGTLVQLALINLDGAALDAAFSPDGRLLYVARGAGGLHSYDLSDPAIPLPVGPVPGVEAAYLVTSAGALLAVDTGAELALIDPTAGYLGQFSGLREGRRFTIQDEYLYVADAQDGLRIFWLAAPDRPLQIYAESGLGASDVALDGALAVTAGPDGLRALDVSDPYRPRELGRAPLPGGDPGGLALGGGRAFLALGEAGLGSFALSAVEGPRHLAVANLRGRAPDAVANDVLFYEDRLYLAAGTEGLIVLDAARPGAEGFLTSLRLPGPALALDRRGDALLIAAGEAGLLAVDISRPEQPVLIGALPPLPGMQTLGVRVEGRRALLSHGDAFSVADIGSLQRMGSLVTLPTPASDLRFDGIYLYALADAAIHIFDARANAEPLPLRSYRGLGEIRSITAGEGRLYVTGGPQGPAGLSVSLGSPDRPYELDSRGAGGAQQFAQGNGYLWLARGFEGLLRYEETEAGAWIPRGGLAGLPGFETLALDSPGWVAAGENLLISEDQPAASLQLAEGERIYDLARSGERIALALGAGGLALVEAGELPTLIAQERGDLVYEVAWSGDRIVVGGPRGLLIFDGTTLIQLALLPTSAPVTALTSPPDQSLDGMLLVGLADGSLSWVRLSASTDAFEVLGRAESRRPLDLIEAGAGGIFALADDAIFAVSVDRGEIRLRPLGAAQYSAARAVWIAGQLALIHPGEALRFYDMDRLGESTIPARLLPLTISPSEDSVLSVEGGLLAAAGTEGLWLLNPEQPELSRQIEPGEVNGLAQGANRIYSAGAELVAWDPASLEAIGRSTLPALARHIGLGAQDQLLISSDGGLILADPTSLAIQGFAAGPRVERAVMAGTRAYLALASGGLGVVDIENPATPEFVGSLVIEGLTAVYDLILLPDGALLISGEGGLVHMVPSDSGPLPHLVQTLPFASGPIEDIAVDGERIALARGAEGVLLLHSDSNLAAAVEGLIPVPGGAQALALQGEMLFVAAGECGLRAYEVSDPAQPLELGSYRAGYAADLALRGETLLLADSEGLLTLRFDASLPTAAPAQPRSPQPADGAAGLPTALSLHWGPAPDECETLGYELYFGSMANPPLLGRSLEGSYEIDGLDPLHVYYWRVVVTDRQGERSEGPLWRFSTGPGAGDPDLPESPPLLGANRNGPFLAILISLALALVVGLAIYFQARRRRGP